MNTKGDFANTSICLVAVMVMANTPNCYIPRAGDESGGND
jgi:hypothetical protein